MVENIGGGGTGLNPQNNSVAQSSAAVLSNIAKELEPKGVKFKDESKEIGRQEMDEIVQKLVDSTAVESIRKYDGKESKEEKDKDEEKEKRQRFRRAPLMYAEPFEWASKKRPRDKGFLQFLFDLEEKILRNVLNLALKPKIEELVTLVEEFKLDPKEWKLETLHITDQGELFLASGITPEERLRILLIDECKIMEIGRILEDSYLKRTIINWRLFKLKNSMAEVGIPKSEIDSIRAFAQKVAFLKLISTLKEMHLKRVFATSRKEFSIYSGVISYLTKKIWRIEVKVPDGGIGWIHQRLETLAIEAARYKLELLKSMDKISPNLENKETIKWLEHILGKVAKS